MTTTQDNIERAVKWMGVEIQTGVDPRRKWFVLDGKGYELYFFRPHEDLNDMRLIENKLKREPKILRDKYKQELRLIVYKRYSGIYAESDWQDVETDTIIADAKDRFNAFIAMLDELDGK